MADRQFLKILPPAPFEKVVLAAHVYKNDVVFKIGGRKRSAFKFKEPKKREKITMFSTASKRRLEFLIRNTQEHWEGFVTLTYPAGFTTDGAKVKRDINLFNNWLRKCGIHYIWVLEFTAVGTPHMHYLVSGWINKTALTERWSKIVDSPAHDSIRTQVSAIRKKASMAFYFGKYMGKSNEQKVVPEAYKNLGRFWGASRLIIKSLFTARVLYSTAVKTLAQERRWYRMKCRQWGFLWEWNGHGFILRDGAAFFRAHLAAQFKHGLDNGKNIWSVGETPLEVSNKLPWELRTAARSPLQDNWDRLCALSEVFQPKEFKPAGVEIFTQPEFDGVALKS